VSSINFRPGGPLILAIDTSSSLGSVALWHDGGVVESRTFEGGHSQRLLPAIDALFTESQRDPSEVDLFAAVIGPGSFTGLRVSLACLRGLAGARPCFGALATDAAAWSARGRGARVLAITDLFHGEVFGCVHDEGGAPVSRHESGDLTTVLNALRPFLGPTAIAVGSATIKHREAIEEACPGIGFRPLPEGLAPHLASLAHARATVETTSKASEILPFYLRDPMTRGLLNTPPKAK
jgi:tRNA threonylcarbamoyladenosine biosynthesis protein TsaB